jgi:hypothetical protein
MITHQQIDARLLGMVRRCVEKIDADRMLLAQVAANVGRIADPRIRSDWLRLLELPWPELRERLLAATEAGSQLRQNAPLGGLLTNAERLKFFQTDLACSKLAAGREKDIEFVATMLAHGMVTRERLEESSACLPAEHRVTAQGNLPIVERRAREIAQHKR